MSIERKSPTDLHSEMIFLQGRPIFLYLPTIYTPEQTDNLPILLKRTNPWLEVTGVVGVSPALWFFRGLPLSREHIFDSTQVPVLVRRQFSLVLDNQC
jgi:hypothetical protein